MKVTREIVKILKYGGIGIMPTDTIYGLVGSALNKNAVERIYRLRRRNPKKPMIILLGSILDLGKFGIKPDKKTERLLETVWLLRKHPDILRNASMLFRDKKRATSVILPISSPRVIRKFRYLHRGTKTLAFRLPALINASAGESKSDWLRRLLAKVGPLVAPSANPEGLPPARTIAEAERYFKNQADFYLDGGKIFGKPSRLIGIKNGKIKVIRR